MIALFGGKIGLFSVLSEGYNMYGTCEFATNIDPLDGNAQTYEDNEAWITIDVNDDGIMEKFGWYDELMSSSSPAQWCGYAQDSDTGNYNLMVEDFNSHTCTNGDEDDIYYTYVTETYQFIYVCDCTGMIAERFRINYGASEDAIIPDECVSQCVGADTNCDGIISRDELGSFITKWINNQVTRDELGEAIVLWVG